MNKYVAKGYNRHELIQKADEGGRTPREQFEYPKTQKQEIWEEVTYISTYDTHAEQVQKSIRKAWYLLQNDSQYGRLFKNPLKFVYY